MIRKKIATIWLGGCSGCHMSLLDIDERILEIAKLADIVKSPIVDGKELPDVDIALVEGAVANQEHLEEICKIRKHAQTLIAFGDCAVTANVPSMRNAFPKEDVLSHSYKTLPSNTPGQIPSEEIAPLIDRVRPLHEVVPVDYHLPGCPPSADLIFYILFELLNDRQPTLDEAKLKYG